MRMTFEGDELERLRHTTSKILLVALWVHVPIALIFGVAVGDNWLTPTCFMVAMLRHTCKSRGLFTPE